MEESHRTESEARIQVVIARAHRPLTDEERALVGARIERDLKNRDELRSLPLANADAPDPGFNPATPRTGARAW